MEASGMAAPRAANNLVRCPLFLPSGARVGWSTVWHAENAVGWPSGLRRQFQALVSSEAWVRIPLQSFFLYSFHLRGQKSTKTKKCAETGSRTQVLAATTRSNSSYTISARERVLVQPATKVSERRLRSRGVRAPRSLCPYSSAGRACA